MSSTHSNLYCHIVFATKNRDPWLTPEWRPSIHAYLGGIVCSLDATPLAIGGVADHVHLLIRFRPSQSISEILREVKRGTSVWIANHFRRSAFAWQEGYGAFSVSHRHVPSVRGYIARQEEHHRTKSFQDEYRGFLRREGIAFEERFLW